MTIDLDSNHSFKFGDSMKTFTTLLLLIFVCACFGCGSVLSPAEKETAEQEIQRVQLEEQAHFQNANQ